MSANVLESRDYVLISFKFPESEYFIVSCCCLAGFILCTYEHFYFFQIYHTLYTLISLFT